MRSLDPNNVENFTEEVILENCNLVQRWTYWSEFTPVCSNGVNQGFAGPYGNSYNISVQVGGEIFEYDFVTNLVWSDKTEFFLVTKGNIVKSVLGEETQLTFDGKFDEIIYGSNDWANGIDKTMFYDSDNKLLYVTKADMRQVDWFEFMTYEKPEQIYSSIAKMRYTNPGAPNPIWEILVFDEEDNLVQTYKNPFLEFSEENGYLQQVIDGDGFMVEFKHQGAKCVVRCNEHFSFRKSVKRDTSA